MTVRILAYGDWFFRPLALYRLLAKNHVIAKPVRTPAVAIRIPRPLGPLA